MPTSITYCIQILNDSQLTLTESLLPASYNMSKYVRWLVVRDLSVLVRTGSILMVDFVNHIFSIRHSLHMDVILSNGNLPSPAVEANEYWIATIERL